MPVAHRHSYTIHKGRFYDTNRKQYYDIWMCACGDEDVRYV